MKKVYNKLIRDRIPEIIEGTGKSCRVRTLDLEEYCVELKKKLVEEANEVNGTVDKESLIKEIADVLEVIDALKVAYGISDNDVDGVKVKKALSNGKFEKGLFLEYVIEEDE